MGRQGAVGLLGMSREDTLASVGKIYEHSMISAQNLSFDNNQGVNIVARDQTINNFNSNYDDEHCNIVLWLSPLNFKASQSQFLQIHEKGTGNWLLESPTFLNWREGTSQTLWCPGNPGAGKTILAAVVVNYLQMFYKDSNVGVACIFCNYKEQTLQTVTNLIASLLKQFVQDSASISENIKSFHRRHKRQGTFPTLDGLMEVLELEIKTYDKVFIVVDALDECSDSNESRAKLLKAIRSLAGPVNLMVTSRNLPSIEQHFREAPRLDIHATDQDVARYARSRLAYYPGLIDMQEAITQKIVDTVRGMFLLAQLHMNALLDQDSEEALLHALDNLPADIDQIYDEAMGRIERQANTKELAKRVLSWIVYASRPLSVEELRHALAVSPKMTKMDRRALAFEWKLTSVCAGLVVIDKEENIVRLAHYTTQQYFENRRESLFPNAEATMAATCLTYLSFDVFACGYCNDGDEFESVLKANPLLDYASRNWGHHARQHQESIKNLAMDFLGNGPKVECASQVMLASVSRWSNRSQDCPRKFSDIHTTAYWGLEKLFHYQLDSGATANKVDSKRRTPLSYAAQRGHGAIVKLLLARNDVEADSTDLSGRTPLFYAVEEGHDALVKLLLARGEVKANLKDSYGQTPLFKAAGRGDYTVVKLLLARNDVEADSRDQYGQTPLSRAALSARRAVVELLLARHDVEVQSTDDRGRTPLSYAAVSGSDAIVKLLLARGDVEANTLSYAAANGREAIVKLLLARDDVEVNSKDSNTQSPLSRAAENGCSVIVKLLLDRDDINADQKDSLGRTPLWHATKNGYHAIVKLLLARDDVATNPKGPSGQTPLMNAVEIGDDAIVKLLLAREDIITNPKDPFGRTPLSKAVERGNDAVVKLLLARDDVEVDSMDWYGRTPLFCAFETGHDTIVKLLLARADVAINSKDPFGRTPLSYAVEKCNHDVVKLLLARGDIEADSKASNDRTPLSYAAEKGNDVAVELLLARGDVEADSKSWNGRTPLSYAAENGRYAVVKLLLARDDVEAGSKNSDGRTPLWYSSGRRHDDIVKLFLVRDDVEVNSRDSEGRTPLSSAAEVGWYVIVKLLLARDDVEADSKDSYGRTPLFYAAERGHDAIVKLLLARDDVEADSKDQHGRTPLSCAAGRGHGSIVKLLLARNDVEVQSTDDGGRTPLFYAVQNNHATIVKLLSALA